MELGVIKRFIDEVLDKSSVQVIQHLPKAASPPKPYATVKFLNQRGLGFSISESVPQGLPVTSVDQLIAKNKIADVEVIFYSNDLSGEFSAANLAEFFETALGFDRSKNFQITNDFGVLENRPARNLDLELGDLIERRQIVEFTINYVHEITETGVDFFTAVETTLTVED